MIKIIDPGSLCRICPSKCKKCTSSSSCSSCYQGYYGSNCQYRCGTACKNGVCDSNRATCYCNTGYVGVNCTDDCYVERHGPNRCPCSLLQHCKSCTTTSNITKCIECDDGYYLNESGECDNCSLTCIEGQCDSLTGECKTGCSSDYWGQLCEHKCNEFCNSCNRSNGECLACASKLKYGPNCNINCSETCVDKECYSSGKCINGCLENNFGEMCENECDKKCISNGNGTTCSSESGECLHGCTPGYTAVVCSQVPEGAKQTDNGLQAASIGGIVAGGVVLMIVIIAVIAFFFLRKRRTLNSSTRTSTLKTDQTDEHHVDSSSLNANVNKITGQHNTDYGNTADTLCQITVISNQNDQTPSGEKTCSEMINEDGSFEFDDDDAIEKENVIRSEENGGVYYNNALEVNKTKVKVDELPLYVTAKPKSSFQEEFERIPNGLTKPYEDSQQARNMSRNRYKGIYPYDDSRVKVWFDGSDYINASVIDGFNERNAYIATLGPMSKQLGDFGLFWEMVWQQHVEKVVMVTNLIEEKKVKCDQYWPNVESSALYGNVYVICLSEEKYAEFTRRTFQISRNSEGRELHQFHFTCWPDRSVPEDVAPLVEFRKMVLNTKTKLNGPTLVHCSAGVGRTGTYIVLIF